jgi:hypothetical protein
MFSPFKLLSPLGRSYNVDLDDTLRTKKALNGLGYYAPPKHGMTRYPDERLFKGLESFQADNGLRKDAVMKPLGPTASKLGDALGRKRGGIKSSTRPRSLLSTPLSFLSTPKRTPYPSVFGISNSVGQGKDNLSKDVVAAKRALSWAGHYPVSKAQKPQGFLDRELMSGIGAFQKENGLTFDNWMGPGGETAQSLDKSIAHRILAAVKKMGKDDKEGDDEEDAPPPPGDDGEDPKPDDPEKPDDPKPDDPEKPEDPKPDDPEKPEDPKPDDPKPDDPEEEENCDKIEIELEKVWEKYDKLHTTILELGRELLEKKQYLEEIISRPPEDFYSEEDLEEYKDTPSIFGRIGYKILERVARGYVDIKQRRTLGEVKKRKIIADLKKEIAEKEAEIEENEKTREELYKQGGKLEQELRACEAKKPKK